MSFFLPATFPTRLHMMGNGNIWFAFGTWVNRSHEKIFLNVKASHSTLMSFLKYLPNEFPGLVAWDGVLEITEYMGDPGKRLWCAIVSWRMRTSLSIWYWLTMRYIIGQLPDGME